MVVHLAETKQYLDNVLIEIDSPAQPKGDLHLGRFLEVKNLETFLPVEKIVHALREYLSFDQYLPLDDPRFKFETPDEVLEGFLKHRYWEIHSQSDDEASAHSKAMRPLIKITPTHVIQTLDIINDIQNGAIRQNLEGLSAYFYNGTKGYAIEFSILPEECTNLKVGETRERVNGGIKITRTDFMTLILYHVEEKKY